MAVAALEHEQSAAVSRGAHLAFLVGGERAAIPLSRVSTVVRPPEITDLPLSPRAVLGLANLRGSVTAIIGLHAAMRLPEAAITDRSRVIVLEHETPVGLLVDQLQGVVEVALDEIEPASAETPETGDILSGILRGSRHGSATLIVDLDRLLGRVFTAAARRTSTAIPARQAAERALTTTVSHERVLVSFVSDGEEYAVPITAVREIVALPATVSRVPHAQDHVLGVVTLRDRLVPLVSARALLGLPPAPAGSGGKVLVLSVEDQALVGLVVDQPREILRVEEGAVEPVPVLLARDMSGDIEGICRLDGGRRLVSIISPSHLLRSDAVVHALAVGGQQEAAMREARVGGEAETEQFITFRVGRVEYGLPIGVVDEVIGVPEQLTEIPKAPAYVAGVVNRRGTVVPVIDQRRRFDLPASEATARHIVVIALGSIRVGLMVDSVTSVLKVPADAIGPAPELSSEQSRLISRIANLGDRVVLLLSPENLASAEEVGTLAEVASGAADGPE
ncbi:chemotaxis protein CheW [Arenibaculum pallidiluteum]|uniref:chemotaxis protein CheW n=1 Tax=Arenibaculum pallidiluteum TaxID=2812559 RepID=UPI001A95C16A|nr:chemotaxis protein CheW [Arenibaculum pallidiluteum]